MSKQQSSVTIGVALLGGFATLASGAIGYRNGLNAVEKDYVQIAVTMLDKEETSPRLRKWAVDVLSELSPVPFERELREELESSGLLSASDIQPRAPDPTALTRDCPDLQGSAVCKMRLGTFLMQLATYNEMIDARNAELRSKRDSAADQASD